MESWEFAHMIYGWWDSFIDREARLCVSQDPEATKLKLRSERHLDMRWLKFEKKRVFEAEVEKRYLESFEFLKTENTLNKIILLRNGIES